jgi:PBP1b-binding outer membrane lipoprotein LpoB
MEKLSNFLNKNGFLVVIIILLLMFVNQCSTKNATKRVAKYQKEMTINNQKQDSIMSVRMENIEKKLDSTLISNGAVIDANRQTSAAINNKKQNIVIKMDKQ